jgi:hypothetical protein
LAVVMKVDACAGSHDEPYTPLGHLGPFPWACASLLSSIHLPKDRAASLLPFCSADCPIHSARPAGRTRPSECLIRRVPDVWLHVQQRKAQYCKENTGCISRIGELRRGVRAAKQQRRQQHRADCARMTSTRWMADGHQVAEPRPTTGIIVIG